MKKILFLVSLICLSCSDHIEYNPISDNVKDIFGVEFSKEHDWNTTTFEEVTLNTQGASKIQILCYSDYATILNEVMVTSDIVTISYDAPKDNKGIYANYIYNNGDCIIRNIKEQNFSRRVSKDYILPLGDYFIEDSIESYACQRGWIQNEKLYQLNNSPVMEVSDYNEEYATTLRMLIFSYFKNGRKYNNLPLVKTIGYYNENSYAITTGKAPIIVSPIYKNDGGYKEVENSDLYYYYFKDSVNLETIPKYEAFEFRECIKDDDVLSKHKSYVLLYFDENGKGSFQFPEGYKIGFMIRANTTAEKLAKQGELYIDGRLNNYINKYGSFKSSKLGENGPRGTWLRINDKIFLCVESGTDTDFNDIILEVEGGIEKVGSTPSIDYNYYTFCFEDSRLGDYDLNDVVLKGRRLNETQVEYTLMACGAFDKLYIYNIEGKTINHFNEIHSLFGKEQFINTIKGDSIPYIIDTIEVSKSFSFLKDQPYIYDETKGWEIKISRKGEDPHAIMVPYDFKWPLERICIKNAYTQFNNWGVKFVEETDWYKYPVENNIY